MPWRGWFPPSSSFFFNDTATTEIYTLSLHDALPIFDRGRGAARTYARTSAALPGPVRSEEHTSELQSQSNLVCRLLLEKKQHHIRAGEHLAGWRPHGREPSAPLRV